MGKLQDRQGGNVEQEKYNLTRREFKYMSDKGARISRKKGRTAREGGATRTG